MQSIIQSKITTPTKTLIQPRIYECYLKGPCGDDYENLSQYVSKTEELHAGLRELLVGTKRADVQPRFIELQHLQKVNFSLKE